MNQFCEIFDYEIYIVGGAVRDQLLGREVKDVDIASALRPEDFKRRCRKLGLKTFDTGIQHGTITVLIKGEAFEHTTFRRDLSCDGRNATVKYADCIEDDLSRRDFTINAMALLGDKLVDPFGGYQDLMEHKVLRTVGEARERFSEDYLRIVRGARFAARFGLKKDEQLIAAARDLSVNIISHVSVERLADELKKGQAFAHEMLNHAEDLGFLGYLLPYIKELDKDELRSWFEHVKQCQSEDELIYFTGILSPLESDKAFEFTKHLKLSKHLQKGVALLLNNQQTLFDTKGEEQLLQVMRTSGKLYNRLKTYAEICGLGASFSFSEEMESACQLSLSRPLILGSDLKKMGMLPGPHFKQILEDAALSQARGLSREEILKMFE